MKYKGNRNSYEKSGLQSRAKQAFGKNFAGLVGGDRHGDIESKTFKNKKNVGKVYYDIEDAQFKRIRKTPDGFGVEVIDINTECFTVNEFGNLIPDLAGDLYTENIKTYCLDIGLTNFQAIIDLGEQTAVDEFGNPGGTYGSSIQIEFELIEPKKRKIVKKSYSDNFIK